MNAPARKTDLRLVQGSRFSTDQIPPHDEGRELALLASILADGRVADLTADLVLQEDFYDEKRGLIYGAMQALRSAGEMVSAVSVVSWLKDRGTLASVGGPMAVAQLLNNTPVLGQAVEHAQKIALKAKCRALIQRCQQTVAEGFGDVGDEREWIDRATKEIRRLADRLQPSNAVSIRQSLEVVFRKLQHTAARRGQISGYTTGLRELDALCAGWHGGQITLIGGETGLGKTAFAGCQAVQVASHPQIEVVEYEGTPCDITVPIGVIFFSLEMPHEDLTERISCGIGRVDYQRIRTGNWDQSDIDQITSAADYLERLPIVFDDDPEVTMGRLEAKIARIESQFAAIGVRLGLVIIDYIQLMDVKNEADKNANREQQFNLAGRRLKNFASRFRAKPKALPVIDGRVVDAGYLEPSRVSFAVLTQLNDDGQVRESKALLQHAHNFWVLEPSGDEPDGPGKTTRAKIRIKKQRHGPRNVVATAWWHSAYTLFSDEER